MMVSRKIICRLFLLTLGCAASSGSGENETKCYPQIHFACADGSDCILLDYRCDGENDCADKSDESEKLCKDNCGGFKDRFRCADGKCIRGAWKACSGTAECDDGSDEDETVCSDCNGNDARWKCKGSTKCINMFYRCDSGRDCAADDLSDEDPSICAQNCGGLGGRFQCRNKKCVYNHKICNGYNDCGDNSDESDETCANCNGDSEKTKCTVSSKCFREFDRCDGVEDCVVRNDAGEIVTDDNSDEENCPFKNESSESSDDPVLLD